MPDTPIADFCIKIDFQRGSESPSRVFRAMYELIETFNAIDIDLVRSIDAKIEPIVIIEDIEAGSLKAWLKYALRCVDDDALTSLDWKPAVGKYLVKGKYIILNFLKDKTEITNRQQIELLEEELLGLAEETAVKNFPSYAPVGHKKLLPDIGRLTEALSYLSENDKAIYITSENEMQLNAQFNFVPDRIEELLTQETIISTTEAILKVKKPDYLGESKWDLKHGTHAITAKILDEEWLKNFQSREYDVRPGDSLRAMLEVHVKYGYDGEVVGTYHFVKKIKEIIRSIPPEQQSLV